jgi:hypothetical protein
MIFLCDSFSSKCEKYFWKEYYVTKFSLNICPQKKNLIIYKSLQIFTTIAYNMIRCLRFFYFHILNIAKFG